MFACNLDKSVKVDITAPTGPTGSIGLRGYDGNSSRWKANTQGITPLTGQFHINTIGNAIVINQFDSNTNDMLSWLQDTKVGDIITIREVDNPAMVGYFSLVSLFSFLLPNVWQATISYISGPITGIVPATVPLFHYIGFVPIGPTGPTGPTGTQGPTGVQGPTGPTRAMALYSFATSELTGITGTAGTSDKWGFASRGLGFGIGAVPANNWNPTAACNLGGGTTVKFDSSNFYGTIVGTFAPAPLAPYIHEGWFNNWYINSTDSTVLPTNAGDERIVVQNEIGTVTPNNYGIRIAGPSTGNSIIDAWSGNNLVPTIWAAHQPFQSGTPFAIGGWSSSPDGGPGVISDYGTGGAAVFSGTIGNITNAANGWGPATQNYIAAPKPNSNGFIAGFNITGVQNAVSTGTFNPTADPSLDDYAYIEIEFVEGDFTQPAGALGRVCRDINPISLIKYSYLTMTCPGSAGGTAQRSRGPNNDDWTTILDPADYIPITNINYFRLRTHIHVQALNSQPIAGNPEIQISTNKYKIGAQLYILWDQ